MKKILIDDSGLIAAILNTLHSAGLVMHPTETCYGLAVDIFQKKALEKLYKVKGMAEDKPVSILVSDLEMAKEYGVFSEKALDLAKKYWPGPLSIVVPRTKKLPEFFNKGHDFVSIRCSDMDFCMKMVKDLKSPVTTTSANFSKEPPLYKVDEERKIVKDVDLVVDGGTIEKNAPSTIVKVDGDEVVILREGDLKIELPS